MSNEVEVSGVFSGEDECARAIETLREAGLRSIRYFAPFPSERILEACGRDRSPVRGLVLAAGIVGAVSGFALTIGTSLTWSHVAGGKPIISLPPYIIIAFELMILFGGVTGALSIVALGGLPQWETLKGFSPRFASDRFGVLVRCSESEAARAESILREAGAEEATREGA